jgi:hypothetical protein
MHHLTTGYILRNTLIGDFVIVQNILECPCTNVDRRAQYTPIWFSLLPQGCKSV